MKIAIVIERNEAWRGGAETSAGEFSRLLLERGHDVHLITTGDAPAPPGMTIHTLPAAKVLRPLRTATFVRRAEAFLRHSAFDIVHAVVPLPYADVYQPRGGLLRETMERNVAMRRSRSRRLMKRAMMAMNVKQRTLLELESEAFAPGGPTILAVSQYVARQCKRHYGLAGRRVRVVFNGVAAPTVTERLWASEPASLRKQYHIADETLVLLFIAHNFRLKGLGPLIETVSRLVASGFDNLRLLVAGRDNPVRFQRRIDALGLGRLVTFTGPTQRMDAFYHAADVCVHPTYYDPCSRVVLEALARGLPCITTSFNGAAEAMCDGREGFIIDSPDDVARWAGRIHELRSPALRERMSQSARALREQISMSRHVDELEQVYSELTDGKAARPKSA